MTVAKEEMINEILKKCKERKEQIRNEFVPPLRDEELAFMFDPQNWEILNEEPDEFIFGKKVMERIYNCEPLDDQLRAYVYTDMKDKTILKVEVQTE